MGNKDKSIVERFIRILKEIPEDREDEYLDMIREDEIKYNKSSWHIKIKSKSSAYTEGKKALARLRSRN